MKQLFTLIVFGDLTQELPILEVSHQTIFDLHKVFNLFLEEGGAEGGERVQLKMGKTISDTFFICCRCCKKRAVEGSLYCTGCRRMPIYSHHYTFSE